MTVRSGNPKAGQRFEALDSLRGVCAVMVALYHLRTPGYIHNSPLVFHSSRFVDFFFVLSGFVIAASYGDKLSRGFSIRKFMALRLGRVYPLHLFMLGVLLLFELVFASGVLGKADRIPFTNGYSIPSLIENVFLVQTFLGPDGATWNSPSWSIAVEVWTYLIFALLYRFARPALVVISIAIMIFASYYLLHLTDRYLSVTHDGALVRCLFGFAAGSLAYRLWGRYPILAAMGQGPATIVELLLIAAVCVLVPLTGGSPYSLIMPVIFLIVILVFSFERGVVSSLLRTKPFLILGTLSYSIYMVHWFLVYRLVNVLSLVEHASHGKLHLVAKVGGKNQVGGSPLFGDCMSILLVVLAICAAALTYRLIERPGRTLSRKLVLGDQPGAGEERAEQLAPAF